MDFRVNHPIIFVMVGVIIAVVIAQSVFFLVKAYKQGIALGMDRAVLNATIKRSALFTIAPAVAIFMGVVSLVNMLGVALPWLRLSIIGAVIIATVQISIKKERPLRLSRFLYSLPHSIILYDKIFGNA